MIYFLERLLPQERHRERRFLPELNKRWVLLTFSNIIFCDTT